MCRYLKRKAQKIIYLHIYTEHLSLSLRVNRGHRRSSRWPLLSCLASSFPWSLFKGWVACRYNELAKVDFIVTYWWDLWQNIHHHPQRVTHTSPAHMFYWSWCYGLLLSAFIFNCMSLSFQVLWRLSCVRARRRTDRLDLFCQDKYLLFCDDPPPTHTDG